MIKVRLSLKSIDRRRVSSSSFYISVLDVPFFIDFLIENGWMIEYICVEKSDEFGRGLMKYFSISGNIRKFIENNIFSIREIKLIFFNVSKTYEIIISAGKIRSSLKNDILAKLLKEFKEIKENLKLRINADFGVF